jgi:DNA polymerase III epsilon subunit-like protein
VTIVACETLRHCSGARINFETTTPKGYRPEPIEVAVISLNFQAGQLTKTARFTELMQPPLHAPVTPFDIDQTGITPAMVADKPPAAQVLAKLDASLTAPGPALLVAHHAPVEAGAIHDYREHCPNLAVTHLLDTVKMAKVVHPDLPSHGLDSLMIALGIPRPADRHRAMADVGVTVDLFQRLLVAGEKAGCWHSLREVRKLAGLTPKAAMPQQEALF